jgi:predicted Zn finger-like uncharacterized protein
MAMLTRCPNCSATFRVTTDQLVSKQGKVRCGDCGQVFSALKSLVHEHSQNLGKPASGATQNPAFRESLSAAADDDTTQPLEALDTPGRDKSASPAPAATSWPAPLPAGPGVTTALPAVSMASLKPAGAPNPALNRFAADPRALLERGRAEDPTSALTEPQTVSEADTQRPGTAGPPPITDTADIAGIAPEGQTAAPAEAEPDPSEATAGELPAAEPVPPAASFLKEKKPQSRAARGLWALAAALLLALALIQAATLWHGEIARRIPDAQPYLAQLCAFTRAEVEPHLKDLTSAFTCKAAIRQNAREITVEGDSLSNDGRAILIVTALLKNRASHPQPFPRLEVTLFDGSDQVITRRVLEPRAYAEKSAELKSEFESGAELPVRFLVDAKDLKPARYQLYVFHP